MKAKNKIQLKFLNYKRNEYILLKNSKNIDFIENNLDTCHIFRLDLNLFDKKTASYIKEKYIHTISWINEVEMIHMIETMFSHSSLLEIIHFINTYILYPILEFDPDKTIFYNKHILQKILLYYSMNKIHSI